MIPGQKEFLLAQLLFAISEWDKALYWNQVAYDRSSKSGLEVLSIDIQLQRISFLHQNGGPDNINAAKALCEETLSKSLRLRHYQGISRSLDLSALIKMYNEDNATAAKRLYLRAIKIKEKINDIRGLGIGWLSIGSCLRHEQLFEEAIEACRKSIKFRNQSGDISGKGKCFQGIGNIYLENADVRNAKKYYRKFLKIAEDTGDEWSVATACYKLADILFIEGKKEAFREALDYCERSLAIRKLRNNREYANCIYIKAKILYRLGETDEAKKLHNEAYELRKNWPNKSDQADSLFDTGLIDINDKKIETGLLKIEEATQIYHSKGNKLKLVEIDKKLKSLHHSIKDGNEHILVRINKLTSTDYDQTKKPLA